jgi:16S rRNA (uracil1498-N3)-methyltransferase
VTLPLLGLRGVFFEIIEYKSLVYRLVIDSLQAADRDCDLQPDQLHYLRRVLRLQPGDRFIALNGQGKVWLAQLRETSAKLLQEIDESSELPMTISLMIALPKGNSFEEIVRCTTELGVSRLIPVISDRTILKPSDAKVQRWRKIAAEAAEQAERQLVPQIFDPLPFVQALSEFTSLASHRYFCVTRREDGHLLDQLPSPLPDAVLMATGCEGGWTPAEIETAIAFGFEPVALGRRILRAVTAPIAALSCLVGEIERDRPGVSPKTSAPSSLG